MKIVVNGYGVFLGAKNGMVCIRNEGKEKTIALGNLSQVVVASGGVVVSSSLLRLLSENNVDLIVLNSNGSLAGTFHPVYRKANVLVRKEQYRAQKDERGLFLAKCFVRGKIMNQYYFLRSLVRSKGKKCKESYYEIRRRCEELDSCRSQKEIIGVEAKAAEVYWKTISEFYDIDGRRKRYNNPDPMNMALNYGYSVLMSVVSLAVDSTNLDPFAGFLHVENPRRPALVVDLMEEFRQPVVDKAVLRVTPEVKDGLLTRDTRREILDNLFKRLDKRVTFNGRKLPIEYHIHLQARRIERFLLGKENYTPFVQR